MRSILLLLLGVPIPIVILIALFKATRSQNATLTRGWSNSLAPTVFRRFTGWGPAFKVSISDGVSSSKRGCLPVYVSPNFCDPFCPRPSIQKRLCET